MNTDYYYQELISQSDYNYNYLEKYKTFDLRNRLRLADIRLKTANLKRSSVIIDVGCGLGDFVKCCQSNGHEAYGWDLIKLPELTYRNPWEENSDLVTFFDSLEHFKLQYDQLAHEVNKLKTDKLLISIPWCHKTSLGESWFNNWRHKRPTEHVHHFGVVGMTTFLNDAGFKLDGVSNVEDVIRVGQDNMPNILTVLASRY
jgi:hypothetical protein